MGARSLRLGRLPSDILADGFGSMRSLGSICAPLKLLGKSQNPAMYHHVHKPQLGGIGHAKVSDKRIAHDFVHIVIWVPWQKAHPPLVHLQKVLEPRISCVPEEASCRLLQGHLLAIEKGTLISQVQFLGFARVFSGSFKEDVATPSPKNTSR